jgi:hypothetical protein
MRAAGVSAVWLVDPIARTLENLRLDGAGGRRLAHADDETARVEPFDAWSCGSRAGTSTRRPREHGRRAVAQPFFVFTT